MSNKLIILALLVGIIYSTSATTPEKTDCGPNQIFDSCGLSCPRTCRNPSPTICPLNCVAGCRCVDGFVRNNNNDCVLQKDC
ncbi:PREDICTED: chymotrypsin inhibitor-like [Polistes canadensis]|uniref:chymotrypsin inhibitor-like n=1 Tax=Polistes canadensis TaxID=91411 RepID=UPI000718BA09|nr:PREDICTED: chymotrypsin inhibitor-like [Polistes canadensis]